VKINSQISAPSPSQESSLHSLRGKKSGAEFNSIEIDGKKITAGKILKLKKGDHLTNANHDYRLVLIPNKEPLRKMPLKDHWLNMVKPIVGIIPTVN
jgi:hypothetical protein